MNPVSMVTVGINYHPANLSLRATITQRPVTETKTITPPINAHGPGIAPITKTVWDQINRLLWKASSPTPQ